MATTTVIYAPLENQSAAERRCTDGWGSCAGYSTIRMATLGGTLIPHGPLQSRDMRPSLRREPPRRPCSLGYPHIDVIDFAQLCPHSQHRKTLQKSIFPDASSRTSPTTSLAP